MNWKEENHNPCMKLLPSALMSKDTFVFLDSLIIQYQVWLIYINWLNDQTKYNQQNVSVWAWAIYIWYIYIYPLPIPYNTENGGSQNWIAWVNSSLCFSLVSMFSSNLFNTVFCSLISSLKIISNCSTGLF